MPELKPKTVLIAEDEKPMAKALQLKLSHSGFLATIASNGEEAMNLILKEKYDIILLDIMMPKRDGFSIMTEMKAKKINTPVVVLSNLSQEDDAKKAKELGAIAFFIKSNTPLLDIIENIKKILGTK